MKSYRVVVGIGNKSFDKAKELVYTIDYKVKKYKGDVYLETIKYGICGTECGRLARLEVDNYGLPTTYVAVFWKGVQYEEH